MFLLDTTIFPWDAAILLLMAIGLSVAIMARVWVRRHRKPLWKRLVVSCIGFLGFFGFLVIVYGSFVEPQLITVSRFPVKLPVSQPMKIVVLSDFHVGPYKGEGYIRRVVQKTNALLPDIVLLAGDYTFNDGSALSPLAPLKDLRASLGVYAVLGNHDSGRFTTLTREIHELEDQSEELHALLTGMGITVLRNEHVLRYVGNDDVAIAGVDDVWTPASSAADALRGLDDDAVVILLAHSPDILLDDDAHRADLITVGHTHGGQVRLPWFGPVPRLPTRAGQQYDEGLFSIDSDTTMAVTRGLGETLARARLLAPPEIMVLEVQPK